MKRTNVVLDEKLIEEAEKLSGLRYTREVIHEAVRIFVKNRRRQRILELVGTVDGRVVMTFGEQDTIPVELAFSASLDTVTAPAGIVWPA